MFKAIVYNPANSSAYLTQINDWRGIGHHLSDGEERVTFDCISLLIDGKQVTVFVDDEGLLKEKAQDRNNFFVIAKDGKVMTDPIVGKVIFAGGVDEEGETLDTEFTPEEVLYMCYKHKEEGK
jgi:hypothetical protein